MVTTGPKDMNNTLQGIISASTQRWDLLDPRKRDAWILRTRSALQADDMLEAVINGPPTAEFLKSKNNTLTDRKADTLSADLMEAYETANMKAYEVLLKRIDVEKRPTLATRIARHAQKRATGTRYGRL